jgi:predicted nucleic acid-binding protein
MRRQLLDSNLLIRHWRLSKRGDLANKTRADATRWASELIENRQSRLIATPVVIEFLAGVQSSHELELARAYLNEFDVIDEGEIPKADWDEARRLAQRVPAGGGPRQLGDCLLRAIAIRFRCGVDTRDKRFPGTAGRQ